MDLSSISLQTVELSVLHPATSEPTGLVLVLRSRQDPEVKEVAKKSIERQRAAARRNKPLTIDQEIREDIKMRAACIIGVRWEGDAEWKGERPDFSPQLAEEIAAVDFIAAQITEQLNAERDFFTA